MFEAVTKFFRPKVQGGGETFQLPWVPDDYNHIEQFRYQLLFVTDELKKGGKYHSFISEYSHHPEPVHPGCYTSEDFHFFFKDLGDGHSYPYALPASFKPEGFLRGQEDPARIKGELWAVQPRAFISLDIHKNVGVSFTRRRIRITYPTTPIAWSKGRPIPRILPDVVKTIEAWMYIGIPEYWKDQIGGIFQNQMETYTHHPAKPWIKNFYRFDP